jgi:hypothetical protein
MPKFYSCVYINQYTMTLSGGTVPRSRIPKSLTQEARHLTGLECRIRNGRSQLICRIWGSHSGSYEESWDITPYSPLKVNRRFWGTNHVHLQCRRISQAINQHEGNSNQCLWWYILRVISMTLAWSR